MPTVTREFTYHPGDGGPRQIIRPGQVVEGPIAETAKEKHCLEDKDARTKQIAAEKALAAQGIPPKPEREPKQKKGPAPQSAG